jgi:hypothetical protein
MYLDAANRKIKEPIDYLIEASKKSRKLCIVLALSECPELIKMAEKLNFEITSTLSGKPIEEWETTSHPNYREEMNKTEGVNP